MVGPSKATGGKRGSSSSGVPIPGPSRGSIPSPSRGSFREVVLPCNEMEKLVNCEMCNCSTLESYLKKHIQYNHMIHKKNIVDLIYQLHYPAKNPKEPARVETEKFTIQTQTAVSWIDDLHLAPLEALESTWEASSTPSKGKGKGKNSQTASCRSVEITPLYTPLYQPEPTDLSPVKNEKDQCPVCGKMENGLMIACDNCDGWYHCVCVGISQEPAPDLNWFCSQCDDMNQSENMPEDTIDYGDDYVEMDPAPIDALPVEDPVVENGDDSDWITVTKKDKNAKKRSRKSNETKDKDQEEVVRGRDDSKKKAGMDSDKSVEKNTDSPSIDKHGRKINTTISEPPVDTVVEPTEKMVNGKSKPETVLSRSQRRTSRKSNIAEENIEHTTENEAASSVADDSINTKEASKKDGIEKIKTTNKIGKKKKDNKFTKKKIKTTLEMQAAENEKNSVIDPTPLKEPSPDVSEGKSPLQTSSQKKKVEEVVGKDSEIVEENSRRSYRAAKSMAQFCISSKEMAKITKDQIITKSYNCTKCNESFATKTLLNCHKCSFKEKEIVTARTCETNVPATGGKEITKKDHPASRHFKSEFEKMAEGMICESAKTLGKKGIPEKGLEQAMAVSRSETPELKPIGSGNKKVVEESQAENEKNVKKQGRKSTPKEDSKNEDSIEMEEVNVPIEGFLTEAPAEIHPEKNTELKTSPSVRGKKPLKRLQAAAVKDSRRSAGDTSPKSMARKSISAEDASSLKTSSLCKRSSKQTASSVRKSIESKISLIESKLKQNSTPIAVEEDVASEKNNEVMEIPEKVAQAENVSQVAEESKDEDKINVVEPNVKKSKRGRPKFDENNSEKNETPEKKAEAEDRSEKDENKTKRGRSLKRKSEPAKTDDIDTQESQNKNNEGAPNEPLAVSNEVEATPEDNENKTKGRSSRRKSDHVKMESNNKPENSVNNANSDEPDKVSSDVKSTDKIEQKEEKAKRGRSLKRKSDKPEVEVNDKQETKLDEAKVDSKVDEGANDIARDRSTKRTSKRGEMENTIEQNNSNGVADDTTSVAIEMDHTSEPVETEKHAKRGRPSKPKSEPIKTENKNSLEITNKDKVVDDNSSLKNKDKSEANSETSNVKAQENISKLSTIEAEQTTPSTSKGNKADECLEKIKTRIIREKTKQEEIDKSSGNLEEKEDVSRGRRKNMPEKWLSEAMLKPILRYRCKKCDLFDLDLGVVEKHVEEKHGVDPAEVRKEIKSQELGLWLDQPDLSLADRNIGLKCFKFFGDKNVYTNGSWKDNTIERLRHLRKDFKKKKITKGNPQKLQHANGEETEDVHDNEETASLAEAEMMITSEESSEINDDSSVSSKQDMECQNEPPLKLKISLIKNKVIKTSPLKKTPKQRKLSTEKVSLSLDFMAQTKKNTPQRSRLNLILDNLREKKSQKGSSDEKGETSSTDTDSSIVEPTIDEGREQPDVSDHDKDEDKQKASKSDHGAEKETISKKGKGKSGASGSGKGKEKASDLNEEEAKEKVDEEKQKNAEESSPVFQCLMCQEKVTLEKDCVMGHLKRHKVTLDDYSKIFVSHRKDEDMKYVRNWVDEKGEEEDETEEVDEVKEDEADGGEKSKPETTRTKFWRKQKEEKSGLKQAKQYPCTKCNKVMTSNLAFRNHQKVHSSTKRSSRRSAAQEDEDISENEDKSDTVDTEDKINKDLETLQESVNQEYQHKKLRLLNASVVVSLDERNSADQELEDASSIESGDPVDSADPDSRPATPDHDYKCVHCGEGFKAAYLLNVHYRTKHFEKIHQCKQCPKTYFSVPELEQHELVHKMQGGGVVKDPGTSHRPGGRPSLTLYSLQGSPSGSNKKTGEKRGGKSKKEVVDSKEGSCDSDAKNDDKTDQKSSEEVEKDKDQQKPKDCDTTSDKDATSLTSKLRKLRKVTSSSKLSHPIAAMITPETQPAKSPEPSKLVAVPESTSDMSVESRAELEEAATNDDSTKKAAAIMEHQMEETSFPLSSTVADSIKDIGAKETVSEVPDSTTTVDEVSSADSEKSKPSSTAFEANYMQFVKSGKPLAFEANYLQFLNTPQTPSWCSPSQSDYKTCSSPEQNSSEYKSCSSSENNSVSGNNSTLHTPPCSTTTQEAPISDLQDLSVSSKPALKRPYTCQDCDGCKDVCDHEGHTVKLRDGDLSDHIKQTGHKRCSVAADPPEEDVKLAAHPEVDVKLAAHPKEDVKMAANPKEDVKLASLPKEDVKIDSNPKEDVKMDSHPKEDVKIASHPEEDVKLASHPEEDVKLASHPKEDVKLAALPEEEMKQCNIPKEVSPETKKS